MANVTMRAGTFPAQKNHSDKTMTLYKSKTPHSMPLTDVPNGEVDVLVLHSLNIETDGRNCCDDFAELQLVENGGLTSSIETNHKNTHLLRGAKAEASFSKAISNNR
jgi:hypothetical protein